MRQDHMNSIRQAGPVYRGEQDSFLSCKQNYATLASQPGRAGCPDSYKEAYRIDDYAKVTARNFFYKDALSSLSYPARIAKD